MGSPAVGDHLFDSFLSKKRKNNPTMPGHIKLVKGAVDPDPTEYLLPSMDMKKADQNKPYEPKKSVWVPCPKTGGYREGFLESGGDIANIGPRTPISPPN